MIQYGLRTLRLCRFRLYLQRYTFTVHSYQEVQLQPGVLLEIVQLLLLFVKRIGHQILIDGSFEASQITLKDVSASSRPQHFYEQSNIRHIHLEHIILRITLHRQASDIGVITAARDVGILQPLQRTQIGLAPASWLHQTILILLILFGQLFGDRAETLTNVRLVLVRGILHHIIAIFLQNSLMRLAHLVHVIRLQEGIDRFRQSTDGYV